MWKFTHLLPEVSCVSIRSKEALIRVLVGRNTTAVRVIHFGFCSQRQRFCSASTIARAFKQEDCCVAEKNWKDVLWESLPLICFWQRKETANVIDRCCYFAFQVAPYSPRRWHGISWFLFYVQRCLCLLKRIQKLSGLEKFRRSLFHSIAQCKSSSIWMKRRINSFIVVKEKSKLRSFSFRF